VEPAPSEELHDEAVELALAASAVPGVAPAEARAALLKVLDRDMGKAQRARVDAALAALTDAPDPQGEDELRARVRRASRRLAAGDLDGVRVALAEWPAELSDSPAAREGRRLAELWSAEARRPSERLIAEVEVVEGAAPVSPEVVAGLLTRVEEARGSAATPQEMRVALSAAEARLRARQTRDVAHAREQGAWTGLRQAWGEDARDREPRLRAFVAASAFAGTRAAAEVAALLAQTQAADARLRVELDRAGRRPVALWQRGGFTVGPLPAGVAARDAFAAAQRVWDPASPEIDSLHDLEERVGEPALVRAWACLHSLRAPGSGAREAQAWEELGRQVASVDGRVGRSAEDPTWRMLHRLWPLAARPWRSPVPAAPDVDDPLAQAWRAVLSRPEARRRETAAPEVATAREQLLAQDPMGCWVTLAPIVQQQAAQGEVALLRSLALSKLAEPLPTLGTRLFAFVEARRALDLDPGLGRALQQLSAAGMSLHRAAPPDLRATLGALVAEVNEARLTLRQESAATLAFLAHHYADTGRTDLARQTAGRAAANWPDDLEVLVAIARIEASHGDPERARQALARVRAMSGGDVPAWARAWLR
jgi:hypothetical protein